MPKKKRGKTLIIPHKRKRSGRTDYKQRLKLLKSGEHRLVVRKSLNNIMCQIIQYEKNGDKVLISADSKELKKFGWNIHSGNIPASYLTGLLCGIRAKKKKIKTAILDMGLCRSTPGSRLYGALKGAIDSGLEIPHSEEVLPKEDRIRGDHISTFAAQLKKEDQTKYKKLFSAYLKNKIDPEDLPKIFEDVKNKILK
jgi:large subunit ribosomal protein L18